MEINRNSPSYGCRCTNTNVAFGNIFFNNPTRAVCTGDLSRSLLYLPPAANWIFFRKCVKESRHLAKSSASQS